jgi:hypothetical protein
MLTQLQSPPIPNRTVGFIAVEMGTIILTLGQY